MDSHPDLIQQTISTHLAVLPIATEAKDNISADAAESSPCFIRSPSDSTALSGSTVTLEAFFRGKPEPYIKWMRGVIFNLLYYRHFRNKTIRFSGSSNH